jgi:hypothetical protein
MMVRLRHNRYNIVDATFIGKTSPDSRGGNERPPLQIATPPVSAVSALSFVEIGRLVLTRERITKFQLLPPPAQATVKDVDEFFSDMDNGPTAEELTAQWTAWFNAIKHLIKVAVVY